MYREHMVLGDRESSSSESQTERWRKFLDKVRQTEIFENVVIMGDLNINLDPDSTETSPLHNVLKEELLDTFPLAGLKQTVTKCTRQVKDQKPSLIDQSWLNNMNKHVKTSNHDTDSDHDIIVTTLKTKGFVSNEETVVRRNFSQFNAEVYQTELLGLRWSNIYDIKDPTLIDSFITENILSVLNLYAPIKIYKSGGSKYNGNKKYSKECIERIRERNRLRRLARRTNSVLDWENWKAEKNRVNNLLRSEARNIMRREQALVEEDMTGRQMWKRVKKIAGWSISLSPTIFSTDTGLISKPKQMADHLNKFFCAKIQDICDSLSSRAPSDPLILLRTNFQRWKNKDKVETFELQEVTPKRVRELFKLLNNSSSEDLNGLSNRVIKLSMEALIHPITHLINQCIRMNKWPNKWKLNKILPLYKNKGDRTDVSNFRPIALLSPISKLVEKEIQIQINKHMTKFNLWNDDMNAYRENFSTISAMIDIMETWTENIDNSFQNLSIFLDLSSAFDCVSASVLTDKMTIYGFGPNTCALMKSYLSFRSQAVLVNGKLSEFKPNITGVPQGSILGPILFNLYSNELPSMCHTNCSHLEDNSGDRNNLFGVP